MVQYLQRKDYKHDKENYYEEVEEVEKSFYDDDGIYNYIPKKSNKYYISTYDLELKKLQYLVYKETLISKKIIDKYDGYGSYDYVDKYSISLNESKLNLENYKKELIENSNIKNNNNTKKNDTNRASRGAKRNKIKHIKYSPYLEHDKFLL